MNRLYPALAALSMIAWSAAIFLPAILVNARMNATLQYPGGTLLMFGALGPLAGIVAWYANLPLAVMTYRLLDNRAPHIALSAIACALAASPLLGFKMPGPHEGADGGPAHYLIGGWLWLAAFTPPMLASLIDIVRRRRIPT